MRKNYILDANILIHDPHSLFNFADNTVIIPVGVISEIDRFKKEQSERGYNARSVVRQLDGLRGERSLALGVDLPGGGRLKIYCEPERVFQPTNGHADIEILRVAEAVKREEPQTPVVIVTKDINLRIRADAVGLKAEDYESDQVRLSDLDPGQVEIEVTRDEIDAFRQRGELRIDGRAVPPNEYALLRTAESTEADSRRTSSPASISARSSALGRTSPEGDRVLALHTVDELWGIKPRNKEQFFAIDALLDENIKLVTLMGKAGTGKTLLAMAAAMQQVLRKKRYKGALVCRPIIPVGRDMGFLPGTVGEKLDPWLKPIADTVDFLLDSGGPVKGHADCESLISAGVIEIQPLTYIRGRSIANRFAVIDEAQNLSPLEVKTVITRIGVGAKVVLTGDPYQIDNPYVDANSNGFTYLINRFRGQSIAAHVELRKGERSTLAELAANLL